MIVIAVVMWLAGLAQKRGWFGLQRIREIYGEQAI